ncbi:hypothetical protein [Cellulomonas endophytica]|uniref:hypothetical protein n=1 Tax=Cellulomonas endophytica TaxID=2494735 RepID=UPI001012132D|nr:hypothetical protein [Cellulomonas endophytica]
MFRVLSSLVRGGLHFGGEDPVTGGPWHHERISVEAAAACGFSPEAASTVAWHADYVDSYLYNPLWWAPGGLSRLKAALSGGPLLKNVHFDDLFSPGQVHTMWRRYTSGTVAGLVWAWQAQDVAAARNVVGVGLHALQDFYSHSNWVDDPARRAVTYLEMTPAQRQGVPLWTASYELPDHLGIRPHGKPAPWCGVLGGVSAVMDVVCHPASPLSDGPLCTAYRACRDAAEARPETIAGVPVPAGVYYLAPAGVALDSTWQAEIGVRVRGLTDITGAELFTVARDLAFGTSVQWLDLLEERMGALGAGAFWDQVRTGAIEAGERERQYEDFSRFPYGFAAVGTYPPPVQEDPEEWYLRVRLVTAGESGAGTDADVVAHAAGRSDVLDHMPRDNPLLAYDDFEAGDDHVYYLGPYPHLPAELVLENRSASAGEVLLALGAAFVATVQRAVDAVAAFLSELVGGPADLVGNGKQVWSPTDLAALPDDAPAPWSVRVDGRAEGRYRIDGDIRRTGRSSEGALSWSGYEVRVLTLVCEKESEWDRASDSDEPFVLALLVNQAPGQVERVRTGSFDDVDTGESRAIGHTFPPVRVPDGYGYLTLPVQVLESDDESRADRDRALEEFATGVSVRTAEERERFTTTLGRAVAADWKLARAEVFAFTRGPTVRAGTAYRADVDRWVRGGERLALPLELPAPTRVDVGLGANPPGGTVLALTEMSPAARWAGAQLTDAGGNVQDEVDLVFGGGDGDENGFARLEPLALEDGRTTTALWTHPKWVPEGTVKGWHPDTVLPPGARFEAEVGFRLGAVHTDGVRFLVIEHHTRDDGARERNPVVDVHKAYTGSLQPVAADLSHLAGRAVGLELRVDAGPSSGQDWAVWVDPRVVGA